MENKHIRTHHKATKRGIKKGAEPTNSRISRNQSVKVSTVLGTTSYIVERDLNGPQPREGGTLK